MSLFSQFSIEEQHGFNKQNLCGWVKDQLKVLLLQILIMPPMFFLLLLIINRTGEYFYLYAGLFLTVFVLLMMVIAPIIIMPMFNKFDPIEENALKKDIEALASEIDYPLSKIEVVDGSTRSSHSNAFQYGFGKIKKIVIFDTLLEQTLGALNQKPEDGDQDKKSQASNKVAEADSENDENKEEEKKVWKQSDFNYDNSKGKLEVLSVVAHELGHWAHYDTVKGLVNSLVQIYLIFFGFSFAIDNSDILQSFGFTEKSVFVSLYLFLMLLSPLMEVLQIKDVIMVRTMEFAADKYSVELGYGIHMKNALIAIHINNSANLNPDWLFSALKYDHPPLIERNAAIDQEICKMMGNENVEEALAAYEKKFEDTLSKRHNNHGV